MPTTEIRASGKTAGRETAEEESKSLAELVNPEIPIERAKTFKYPGFSRFRTEWDGEDKVTMTRIRHIVELQLAKNFRDAYAVMLEVYSIVRVQEEGPGGEGLIDSHGFPVWKRSGPAGAYIEDWTKLTSRQKENLLFSITTKLFDWEQRAADAWLEAMMAKGIFEEQFANYFDEPIAGTIEDRRARANARAAEERYFAIFQSAYSRKAEAVVRSMTLLSQRLKDSLD